MTITDDRFANVYEAVKAERQRAEEIHDGDANIETAVDWISLITEELGEAAQFAHSLRWVHPGNQNSIGVQKHALSLLYKELIQVAQLAMSAAVWAEMERGSDE